MTGAGTAVRDVAIVGAGPVGVALALALARDGLDVVVLERSADLYPLPRAIAMDAEVQRFLASLGLDAFVRTQTTALIGAEFVDAKGVRLTGFDLPPGTLAPQGYPPMVMYEQPDMEGELRRAATAAGAELRLGVEVTAIEQHADHVEMATTTDAVSARWVVGCDGASSTVRRLMGAAVDDLGFDQPWLVVDLWLTGDHDPLPPITQQICDPARTITYVPGHTNRRRFEIHLHDGEDPPAVCEPSFVWGLLAGRIGPGDAEITRAAAYRFHGTVTSQWRNGRVLLAGDAAHQMPPFNGQGLCSGMRDVMNLSWKLAAVLRGRASDRLVRTYEAERRPHATSQVMHAIDAGKLIDHYSGRVHDDHDVDAGYGGTRPPAVLGPGITVGSHPAVGQPFIDGSVEGDGRWILAGTVGDALAAAWSPWQPHVAASAAAPPGGVVIVRPDRYVAAVATDEADAMDATASLLAMC
jgi:3-(3-hydroxy-phenyl)propionate hydroxylase